MTFTLKLDSGLKPLPCPGSTASSNGGWECEMSTDNSTDLLNREMDVLSKYSFIAQQEDACGGTSNGTSACLGITWVEYTKTITVPGGGAFLKMEIPLNATQIGDIGIESTVLGKDAEYWINYA